MKGLLEQINEKKDPPIEIKPFTSMEEFEEAMRFLGDMARKHEEQPLMMDAGYFLHIDDESFKKYFATKGNYYKETVIFGGSYSIGKIKERMEKLGIDPSDDKTIKQYPTW